MGDCFSSCPWSKPKEHHEHHVHGPQDRVAHKRELEASLQAAQKKASSDNACAKSIVPGLIVAVCFVLARLDFHNNVEVEEAGFKNITCKMITTSMEIQGGTRYLPRVKVQLSGESGTRWATMYRDGSRFLPEEEAIHWLAKFHGNSSISCYVYPDGPVKLEPGPPGYSPYILVVCISAIFCGCGCLACILLEKMQSEKSVEKLKASLEEVEREDDENAFLIPWSTSLGIYSDSSAGVYEAEIKKEEPASKLRCTCM